jgi:tRNA dimethylallyltransferase
MRLTGNLLVILGPTAVGKTGLAIELAQALNGEIISADSRQIYRYMDIGTAKPTPAQRRAVPHHLLDVVNPDENLALAQYQKMAYEAIDAVHQRGRLPLLVGGTGQYITAVVEGWRIPQVPPNDRLRAELEAFAAEYGSQALHDRLRALDPTAAANINHRNVRRVVRALEVCLETGQPISELQRRHPPPYRIRTVGLTLERETLYRIADARVEQMMAEGFLDEARRLLDMGYSPKLPSMSGLGYAELSAHLAGTISLEQAVEDTKNATHDFVRRQYTWFRGHDNGILWHNRETMDIAAFMDAVARWAQKQV